MNTFAVITADFIDSKSKFGKGVDFKPRIYWKKDDDAYLVNFFTNNDKYLYDVIKGNIEMSVREYLDVRLKNLNFEIQRSKLNVLTIASIRVGDELQIVCKNLNEIPVLLRMIRYYCLPLKLRIGIGIGTINYFGKISEFNNSPQFYDSWDMNGEAFYRARLALDSLGKEKISSTNAESENIYNDLIINTIYSLINSHVRHWSLSQWISIQAYEQYETYEHAAKELHMSGPGVFKNCSAANWQVVKEAEKNLGDILKKMYNLY